MITHIVLMRPRNDLTAADRRSFVAAFETALREIPSVRGARIGRRVKHGAAYESAAADFDYIATIEFDDIAGLQTYLQHPAHQPVGDLFGRLLSSAMAFDFDVGGVDELPRLMG